MSNYLAVDLGAESGRVMLAAVNSGRLILEELHRFPNEPVQVPSGLYWDSFRLFHEIARGLTIAARERKLSVDGIGVDTWGVDFGLLDADGALVDCPRHYRDARTIGIPERLFEVVPREEVFASTGIQIMALNSLYQWYAMHIANVAALKVTHRLLFMPDLLNYWLTGVQRAEVTIASTSQFFNSASRGFATGLLEKLALPARILAELIEPGRKLGTLRPVVGEMTGLGAAPVYATASHDTASAVAAVPAEGDDWCYISSGTWSLMGVELSAPVINEASRTLNFTNEAGFGGSVRFLKNLAGLWPLQECRRAWTAKSEKLSYEELTRLAEEAGPAQSLINLDDFAQPGDMPERIAAASGSRTKGEICRVILESLARQYREVLEGLESLTGKSIRTIHIVGGGSRNGMLNQLTANATGRRVVAGPVEATAAGNALVQAVGAGEVADGRAIREIVRRSFALEVFEPR